MRLGDKLALTITLGFIVAGCILGFARQARPQDASPQTPPNSSQPQCPTPAPCKILFLNEQEEQVLTGERGILETANQGRPLDLGGAVAYFRDKIRNARPGAHAP